MVFTDLGMVFDHVGATKETYLPSEVFLTSSRPNHGRVRQFHYESTKHS